MVENENGDGLFLIQEMIASNGAFYVVRIELTEIVRGTAYSLRIVYEWNVFVVVGSFGYGNRESMQLRFTKKYKYTIE